MHGFGQHSGGSRGLDRFHPALGSRPEGAIPVADWVRAHARIPMSADERLRRALATWRRIDTETDTPEMETRKKASRLAYVASDLQQARSAKAQLRSVFHVVRFLMAVIARSYGLRFAL